MMKKLSLLVLLLVTCLTVGAQNSVLGKINKIKTDKEYIYGEATLSTEDDARELANEMLVREANNWAAHVCDTEDAELDADAVTELAESLDLPRGNMVRVFVYVKKTALKPVLEDAGLEIAESGDEEKEEGEEEVGIEMTDESYDIDSTDEDSTAEGADDAGNYEDSDADDKDGGFEYAEATSSQITSDSLIGDLNVAAAETAVAVGGLAAGIESGLQEASENAVEGFNEIISTDAASHVTQTTDASTSVMTDEELLDAYLFGSAMMSAADQRAAEQVAAKKAAAIKPVIVGDNDALNTICGVKSFYDLKSVMVPLKKSGKITRLGKYTTMDDPENSYLIIYDTNGHIRAVLGKGDSTRENLKTKQEDSEHNYKGCGAIWFQLNED